ncbi:DgyrCDS2254 [Dimorphilus gyrociliatus]|uniref:Threonine synthase-like 2 n=1 Tax=Dimorphilus gyrociliatus TaxID=2664684 RepID=A0A7I8V9X3_9ANNE|nr:DgyrCDS2254 [Dimorphilus gyrociliatus]
MKFSSTRGIVKDVSLEQTVFSGYALDGGIFLPNFIPKLTKENLELLRNLSYVELAEEILSYYVENDQIPKEVLKGILRKSWGNFAKDNIVEMASFDNIHIMELFHGPTLAFKDLAMRILGQMMQYFLARNEKTVTVLVGTSGDTGSSAIEAVKGLSNINIIVLLPKGKCSPLQALQMTSVNEKNVLVFEVEGTSDDLDRPIKECFGDVKFVEENSLCSMNSINWIRIMVQVVHYFYAYFKVAKNVDETVEIAVPNGAMGNITGGFIAQQMGLPINLVACTNENDITAKCIKTGDLVVMDEIIMTPAPSMDISFPYNIERIIYLLSNRDTKLVTKLMTEFESKGKTTIPSCILERMQKVFLTSTASNSNILSCIQEVHDRYNYLICPHTATAVCKHPQVAIATASPAKFPEVIESIGLRAPIMETTAKLRSAKNYARSMKLGENWLEILKQAVLELNSKKSI